MITTATSSLSSSLDPAFGAAVGAAVTVVLIALLVQRELAATAGPRLQLMARYLSVSIAPLLVTFAAIVVSRLLGLGF
jgi:hypothetical protein